jgi:hypothetical protein
MATQTKVEDLRVWLQDAELRPEERDQSETLLAQAEQGDEVALARIEQVAYERGFGVRGYSPLPGQDPGLPPGPVLVCPKDPAHYRTFQREVGETRTCPVHKVPLVAIETDE